METLLIILSIFFYLAAAFFMGLLSGRDFGKVKDLFQVLTWPVSMWFIKD
tara:strand:- start:771 stop:920 length:150 start_codon:yes stop_codon:yes gene_type:complete